MTEFDQIDETIIKLLRRDSRISNADLAEKAGLSASSCWRRVRALEETGVIRRYSIEIGDRAYGRNFAAIVHIKLARHDPDSLQEFVREIQIRDEIRACYATSGKADYHLHVVCSDLDAYNRFLENVLFRIQAVTSVQTNLILRTLKD